MTVLELELDGVNDEAPNAHWIADPRRLCPGVERFWGDYKVT